MIFVTIFKMFFGMFLKCIELRPRSLVETAAAPRRRTGRSTRSSSDHGRRRRRGRRRPRRDRRGGDGTEVSTDKRGSSAEKGPRRHSDSGRTFMINAVPN